MVKLTELSKSDQSILSLNLSSIQSVVYFM